MKIGGIVAEWNPLHNGHQYLITQAKAIAPDGLIGIMSGHFTERGQIAAVNKWHRTKMALSAGIDLVLELPCPYALSPANRFAFGALFSLHSLGIVTHLIFGTEEPTMDYLMRTAHLLENEPPAFQASLRQALNTGLSYPVAQAQAIALIFGNSNAASLPNNILAIEYLRSLLKLSSSIIPCGIPRVGVEHHATEANGIYKSASAIRRDMGQQNYQKYVPAFCSAQLEAVEKSHTPFLSNKLASDVLLAAAKTASIESLSSISEVSEGLENRIHTCAEQNSNLEELITAIKTKRYTRTKIERILWKNVLHITKDFEDKQPTYLRVLGMNQRGAHLLSMAKKRASLPLVVKPSLLADDPIFKTEALATSIYRIWDPCLKNEWQTSPIFFD